MKTACALLLCLLAVSTITSSFAQRSRRKVAFTELDFLNVVEGLLEGIGAAESWTDVQPCIETSEDAVQNVITAIEYFEKEDPVSVAYGLAALAQAFADLPTAITTCVATAEDVEVLIKSLEAISNPTTFLFIVAKNLIINGVDIYDEIYTAVDDFNAGKWKDFGFNIGEALAKVFFDGITTTNDRYPVRLPRVIWRRKYGFNGDDFLLVAKGVIEGIGAAEGWDQLAPCINSTEDAVENIITAVKYFEKEDPVSVALGLAALAKALSDLPTSIQSCGAIVEDVEKLIKSLEAISNPTTFIFIVAKNLIVNGVDIYDEIYTAVDDFKAGNWEDFGYNIGEALAQIFFYGTVHRRLGATKIENVLLFIKGAIEGISTDPLFDQIAPCINNATSIGLLIDEAVNDFITERPDKVIAGLVLLAEALYSIPTAISDCGVAYTQLQVLVDAISQLQDPRTIVYRIARSLIINGQETWDKITDATTNINNGNYEAAGIAIGTIIDNIIRPDAAVAGSRFTKFLEKRAPFKVNPNHKFVNWTRGQLKALFGTRIEDVSKSKIPQVNTDYLNVKLPQNFSAWAQWPQCEHPILDQAQCGSCWAFGAAETLSDRFCIASQGKINVQLSPQYLVSCSTGNLGCNGGILTLAWASLERSGLPTLDCTPYTSQSGDTPYCSDLEKGCTDGTPLKRYYAKYWSTTWYISVNSIKTEILQNGPVESAFTVYEDFLSYSGGVYKYTSGSQLGGHAIKIIGWGTEDGQDYWLVANSWGSDWGLQGYFKMAIGDSGMDNSGIAATPDLDNLPKSFLLDDFLSY